MRFSGKNIIVFSEILMGDVWVCSVQSNMEFWIPAVADPGKAHDDLPPGYWKSANRWDVLCFSAVAYFFAKDLYEKYHIPIGLINASVGGSRIEAWMSEGALKTFPGLAGRAMEAGGPGLSGPTPWYDPAYIPRGWRQKDIPGFWADEGGQDLDGTMWYRRYVDVPAVMAAGAAKVFMGRMAGADFLYINGKLVGNTTCMYPQRRYRIPGGEVGDRFAVAAEKPVYGEPVVCSGPALHSSAVRGDTVILSFEHTGSGLVTSDRDSLQECAIAGPGKSYVWAHARIFGNILVVWNETLQDPKYIGYAWEDEPVDPSLFNKEGLPAFPSSVSE